MNEARPAALVAAVVVNYDAGSVLVRGVESLRRAGAARIVVVDNASTDGSVNALSVADPEVEIVRQTTNRGYGSAANAGERRIEEPYVLVVNPDVTVEESTLDRLASVLDAEPDVAAVGPLVLDATGEPYPSARSFPNVLTGAAHAIIGLFDPNNRWSRRYRAERAEGSDVVARDADWVSGSCVLLRKIAFDSVAGFDEGYFMYVEDLDLCWRLRRAGWRVRFEPAAVVVHDQGVSTRSHPYRMLVAHHRSTLRFARKSMTGVRSALVPAVALGLMVRLAIASGRQFLASRRRGPPPGHG